MFYLYRMAAVEEEPYPYIEVEIESNSYNTPKAECISYVSKRDGGKYFVKLVPPAPRRNLRSNIQARVKLYTAATFESTAPDGIYTWIFGDKEFFAAQSLSLFEYGTKHMHIAEQTGTRLVFMAGECSKEGGEVSYNLLSGTYTLPILEMGEKGKNGAEFPKKMEARAGQMFRAMGFRDVKQDQGPKSLLTERGLPLKDSELSFYTSLGFKIELYKDYSTCRGWKQQGLKDQIRLREQKLKQEHILILGKKKKLVRFTEEMKKPIRDELEDLQKQLHALEEPILWKEESSPQRSRSRSRERYHRSNNS